MTSFQIYLDKEIGQIAALEKEKNYKEATFDSLIDENHELRIKVAELNTKLNSKNWPDFRKTKTLLIGDSMIKNVDGTKLEDTKVVSLSGACIKDLIPHLESNKN